RRRARATAPHRARLPRGSLRPDRLRPGRAPFESSWFNLAAGVRVVLHRANRIAFGVPKENEIPDGGYERSWNDDRPAVRDHGRRDGIDVVDAEGALEPDRALSIDQLAAPLQRAAHGGVVPGPRKDLEEVRRPPRLEAPTEHALVEPPRARNVVGVDRKMLDL